MSLSTVPHRVVCRVWPLPWTLFGSSLGLLGLLTGGRSQWRRGAIEFHGGAVSWFLRTIGRGAAAMTFGHCILGRSADDLDCSRDHEHVHVAQYERWGVLFIPAYLASGAWLWLRGKRAYWDNPFEREAYGCGAGERRD